MNLERAFGELAGRLRRIEESLCCSYDTPAQLELDPGGTDTYTFPIGSAHSIAWLIDSGSMDITFTYKDGSTTTVEYVTAGVLSFSQTNQAAITFTVLTGTAIIQWTY